MPIQVVPKSRLNFGQPRVLDGIEHFDTLNLPEIPVQTDDTQYTVVGGDHIDKLAFKFYSNAVLWWVIAVANDLELLPVDLVPGQVLRIPSARFVSLVLFNPTRLAKGT
jgi:nucleoid-associated protein YgaU